MIWIIIVLLLIGSGVSGWLTSSILHQDPIIESRKDWGRNGMSTNQCATTAPFNETHYTCVSEDNHNI